MTKKLLTVLGTLSLVACGGEGVPYGGGEPPLDGPSWGMAGSYATGGGPIATAGSSTTGGGTAAGGADVGAGGEGEETGGTDSGTTGGYGHAGTYVGGAGGSGGYAQAGAGGSGGYDAGGASEGGEANGGTGMGGGTGSVCSQNVAQCFDAAANCYQYSPWSDCDQIVDVCAAMQAECSE